MSTHIVIDGYNVIRQSDSLSYLESISMEEGRTGLLRLLCDYRKIKGHAITVVFDGWMTDNIGQSRDRLMGIDVLYSGRGEKADEVIKRMAQKLKERVVIVTSDREIAAYAERRGAAVIPSQEFEVKLRASSAGEQDYPAFDGEQDEEYETRQGTKKVGPPRRLPKAKRKGQKRISKL